MSMNKGGGGGKGGGFTPTIDLSQFQQFAPQAPTMQQSNYNPMMDMYGSSTQVMQPMPGYYNQYPMQGSNYQPYQPPQVAAPVQPPVQVGAPVQPPWAQQGPQQGPQQSTRMNNQNFAGRNFPREDNSQYSIMPVRGPVYMPTTRPPELQQSYARPQTKMPILDQASAGFGGYSQTPRFNFGQNSNFGVSM